MVGNVEEWCLNTDETLDTEITTGGLRVVRGGSWSYRPANLRASTRLRGGAVTRSLDYGFRLVQDIP